MMSFGESQQTFGHGSSSSPMFSLQAEVRLEHTTTEKPLQGEPRNGFS